MYFSDRPRREAGHLPSKRFLELWDDDTTNFAVEPPHAVLSFLDEPAEALADVVVVLHEPRLDGDQLTYRVEVLNGTLPPTGGPCSLFIDSSAVRWHRSPFAGCGVLAAEPQARRLCDEDQARRLGRVAALFCVGVIAAFGGSSGSAAEKHRRAHRDA